MRKLLTLFTAAALTAASATAAATPRKRTTRSFAPAKKKTQPVTGYTKKNGKKVAPYKRRPAQ